MLLPASEGSFTSLTRTDLHTPTQFIDTWCAFGLTHLVAFGLGHRLADIAKVDRLLVLSFARVSLHRAADKWPAQGLQDPLDDHDASGDIEGQLDVISEVWARAIVQIIVR